MGTFIIKTMNGGGNSHHDTFGLFSSKAPEPFYLYVNVVTSKETQEIAIQLPHDGFVSDLAKVIAAKFKLPAHNQRIIYMMRELRHHAKLTTELGFPSKNGIILYVFDLGEYPREPQQPKLSLTRIRKQQLVVPIFGRCPDHGVQNVEIALVCGTCFQYGRDRVTMIERDTTAVEKTTNDATSPHPPLVETSSRKFVPLDWRAGVEVIYSSSPFRACQILQPDIPCFTCGDLLVPLVTGMQCGCESLSAKTDILWNVTSDPDHGGCPQVRFTCGHHISMDDLYERIQVCSNPRNLLIPSTLGCGRCHNHDESPVSLGDFFFRCPCCINDDGGADKNTSSPRAKIPPNVPTCPRSDEEGFAHRNSILANPLQADAARKTLDEIIKKTFRPSSSD